MDISNLSPQTVFGYFGEICRIPHGSGNTGMLENYCIDFAVKPAVIRQENCLHCGNCLNVCPQKAVVREE